VGWKRQDGGNRGEIRARYRLMRAMRRYFITFRIAMPVV
jgi:hypothetical protein